MKKYKLLRFGHCYINSDGSFIIGLLHGDKRHGYWFVAHHVDPMVVCLDKIMVLNRIVPNDGHWTEISLRDYNVVASFHIAGYKVKPAPKGGPALISKY